MSTNNATLFTIEVNEECWFVLPNGDVFKTSHLIVSDTTDGLLIKIKQGPNRYENQTHRRVPRSAFYDVVPLDVVKRIFYDEPTPAELAAVKRMGSFYKNVDPI